MTDQEIEQLAFDRYPDGVGIIRFLINYLFVASDRTAFIEGAKAIRDKYEQKLKLIELMNLETKTEQR